MHSHSLPDGRSNHPHGCRWTLFTLVSGSAHVRHPLSPVFDSFIMALIVLNVVMVIVDTEPSVHTEQGTLFRVAYWWLEFVSVHVFAMEYLCRFWVCVEAQQDQPPWAARLRWATSPLALVDLASIPPFVYDLLNEEDDSMRGASLLRSLRIISLLRLERKLMSFRRVFQVIRLRGQELGVTLFVALILLLLSSSLMYVFENPTQPDSFPSIAAGMWWGVTALTTVGYGDVYPVTISGKILGSIVAFLGVGFFALPAGIVGSGFVELMIQEKEEKEKEEERCACPSPDESLDGQPRGDGEAVTLREVRVPWW